MRQGPDKPQGHSGGAILRFLKTEVNDPKKKTTCLKLRKSTLKLRRWGFFSGFVHVWGFCMV